MSSKQSQVININEGHKKESFLVNALQSTLRRISGSLGFGISPDGKRDYNALFGYGEQLCYNDFFGMYKRSGIGNVIVKKVARACWGEIPKIMSGETQILEKEIATLSNLGFFAALQRADILNRIGNFSVLLIGVPDGGDLDTPIGSAGKQLKNIFFNPYNYDGITITKWNDDVTSPRYQLPEIYQLQTSLTADRSKDVTFKAVNVHWSRVIHLAEGGLDSTVEGESALEAPWNALLDCEKVRGGSSEAFFRNARQQRALEADKDAQLDPAAPATQTLKDNIEAFDNGWESTLRLQNMSAKHLPINLASPRETFDIAVETISGQTGIAIRVLTGKGGGQLAGTEDRAAWDHLILDRQNDFCSLVLIRGLQIFAEAGIINIPDDALVEWPTRQATSDKEQAEINERKASTLDKIVTALGKPIGDEIDAESALAAVGLEDIEIDTSAIDTNEPEPEPDIEPDAE